MSKPIKLTREGTGRWTSVTLGHEAFARISAVEGIHLSPEAKARASAFDRQGLSPEERRKAIVRVHTPKK